MATTGLSVRQQGHLKDVILWIYVGSTSFTKMQKDLITNLLHQAVQEMLQVWFLQQKYPNLDPAENPKEHVLQYFGG